MCGTFYYDDDTGEWKRRHEDFSISLSIPDDDSLFRVPADYLFCDYYDQHLYAFYDDPLSWTEAEEACKSRGGHLASVGDEEEQEFLLNLTHLGRAENIWIGGYYRDGYWEWTDDSSFYFENWDMHKDSTGKEFWQPDNYTGDEYYLRYANRSIQYEYWYCNAGKWNDTANRADGASGDAPLSSFGYVCKW
ncbi:MAG: C-type lectin domain-containing protein [Oscillospiraceae bacterium]|nr:C-type lectin domain-containing protein [Oscillospiraceae bacterium]